MASRGDGEEEPLEGEHYQSDGDDEEGEETEEEDYDLQQDDDNNNQNISFTFSRHENQNQNHQDFEQEDEDEDEGEDAASPLSSSDSCEAASLVSAAAIQGGGMREDLGFQRARRKLTLPECEEGREVDNGNDHAGISAIDQFGLLLISCSSGQCETEKDSCVGLVGQ